MLQRWTEGTSALIYWFTIHALTCPGLCRIVASLVRAQPLQFLLNISKWLLVAVPATWTNSWLSYVQNKLSLAYRTRLTKEVMAQYLGNDDETNEKIFYKLGMACLLGHVLDAQGEFGLQRIWTTGLRILTSKP